MSCDFSQVPTHAGEPRRPLAGLAGGAPDTSVDPLPTRVADSSGPEPIPRAAEPDRSGGDSAAPAGTSPQLSKTTSLGPTDNGCGGFEWGVQWNLSKAAPNGGYVVQELKVRHDRQACSADAKPYFEDLHYWEGWPISKGKTVTTVAERGDPADDWFSWQPTPEDKKSTGKITYAGQARYYDGIDVAEWGFTITHKAPTFGVPMRWADPNLPDGSNAVTHNLTASWDCCATGKDASTTTTLLPT